LKRIIVFQEWNSDDLQLLIKAVNLFPAGTNQRWDVVAEFINQHTKNQVHQI
jgi:DnaJ family protein C protein 2